MALNPLMLHMLVERMNPGARVAAMGYPDIVMMPHLVAERLGDRVKEVMFHSDSDRICRRHGIKYHPIPGAHSLIEALGGTLEVFDMVEGFGVQNVRDLNYPFPATDLAQYDFVLDIGTMEHCFNIGQAALNMAGMLKAGGVIFHENPFNWGNHGFYGLNPTWYGDFYAQDGFELLDCRLIPRTRTDYAGRTVDVFRRFFYFESEANLFASAIRHRISEIGYPVQTKYAKALGAKLVPAVAA